MQLNYVIIYLLMGTFLFADPPDWQVNSNGYDFLSTINVQVLQDGISIADDGDMLAAFDADGIVRGVATQQDGIDTFADQIIYEILLFSNAAGDELSFKYYDASEDAILEICQTYGFVINDLFGTLLNPKFYYTGLCFVNMSFSNLTTSSVDITYESNAAIAGFQFDVDGVTLTSASGGDAEENGLSIIYTSTVIGFSISGAYIPAGSGILLSLTFNESSAENTFAVSEVIIADSEGSSIPSSGPFSIQVTPSLFDYNQSPLQAFYYFTSVKINTASIDSDDWVGAFNCQEWNNDNDSTFCEVLGPCVGSRKWDTSNCGGGICDLPLMGEDGSDLTDGYMTNGDIPTFQIYDASEDANYDAVSSEDIPWYNFGLNNIELLKADVPTPGCMDNGSLTDSLYPGIEACNYDNIATEDDDSCIYSCIGCMDAEACNYNSDFTVECSDCCLYPEENYDCDDNCTAEIDCAGECGGSAEVDECGVCNGDGVSCSDCAGVPDGANELDDCGTCDSDDSNDCTQDCVGIWGGSLVDDDCGICGGDNSTCTDCNGIVNGNNLYDHCGEDCIEADPEADCSEHCDADPFNDCTQDCEDIWGGIIGVDECGICDGNNSTCADCAGVPNGANELDNCGTCDSDASNDCTQDCAGIWGGSLLDDECGVCNGNNSTCADCAGVPNGANELDNCGTCDSDASNDCTQDCAGIWDGSLVDDGCGICGGNNSTCTDCNGDINGNNVEDNCGTCDADPFNDCGFDCEGTWGGSIGVDDCGICDGNNSTCADCAGVPNGSKVEDDCGTCDDDPFNDCTQDCAGEWGGDAIEDACGTCNGTVTDPALCLCPGGEEMDCAGLCSGDNLGLYGTLADDECGICGVINSPIWNSTCLDCAGVPNGAAVYDICGLLCLANTSSDDCSNYCDDDPSNDCVPDCAGNWGGIIEVDCTGECDGNSIDDECGVCNGNNSTCMDCAGVPNGANKLDDCVTCDSDASNDCTQDCEGIWGGIAVEDECDVCGGDGTSCESDCAGVPNGAAVYDICGLLCLANTSSADCSNYCDDDPSNDCVPDCAEVWGGIMVSDCAGECGGNSIDDECGVCNGNNSTCTDCAGIPNGANKLDDCVTCDSDASNDCTQDCEGIWGGMAVEDECGVCDGDCYGEEGAECGNYDCDGNCIVELDCNGTCGGSVEPDFECPDGDIVCAPNDCMLDIQSHLLPDKFGINKIFPNPFNPVTQVKYDISSYAFVKIRIFDIRGREVTQLMNQYHNPGQYHLTWDAGNHASGMYIVEMVIRSGDDAAIFRDMRKILYLK